MRFKVEVRETQRRHAGAEFRVPIKEPLSTQLNISPPRTMYNETTFEFRANGTTCPIIKRRQSSGC